MESFNYYTDVLKKYADFNGRARRSEYWYFILFNIIISIILGIIDGVAGLVTFGIADAYSLGVFIPSIAVIVRRMHDLGKSGWYCLIPIYNIILAATEGEAGTNDYGVDPKNSEVEDVIDHLVE
ncbi:MAG: uncharacterized membrane protein YhaH (DUF805 family) [Saprospiraceae bacterium]|jgi:uncharacterized membrane protein YhaH (DUF805 family)